MAEQSFAASGSRQKYPTILTRSQPVFVDTQLQEIADFHLAGRAVDSEYSSLIDTVDRFVQRYLSNLHNLTATALQSTTTSQQTEHTKIHVDLPSILLIGIHAADSQAIVGRIQDEIATCDRFRPITFSPLTYIQWDEYQELLITKIRDGFQIDQLYQPGLIISLPVPDVPLFFSNLQPFITTSKQLIELNSHHNNNNGDNDTNNNNQIQQQHYNIQLQQLPLFDYIIYRQTFYNSHTCSTTTIMSLIHLLLRCGGLLWLNAISSPIFNPNNHTKLTELITQFQFNPNSIQLLQNQSLPSKLQLTKLFSPNVSNSYLLSTTTTSEDIFECVHEVFTHPKLQHTTSNQCDCDFQSLLKWLPYSNSHVTSFYVDTIRDINDAPMEFDSLLESISTTNELNESINNNDINTVITPEQEHIHQKLLNQYSIISPVEFEQVFYCLNGITLQSSSNSLLHPISALFQKSSKCYECQSFESISTMPTIYSTEPIAAMYHLQPPEERRIIMQLLDLEYQQQQQQQQQNATSSHSTDYSISSLQLQFPLLFSNEPNPIDSDISQQPQLQTILDHRQSFKPTIQSLSILPPKHLNKEPPSPSFYYYSMQDDQMSMNGQMLSQTTNGLQLQSSNNHYQQQQQQFFNNQFHDVSDSISTDFSIFSTAGQLLSPPPHGQHYTELPTTPGGNNNNNGEQSNMSFPFPGSRYNSFLVPNGLQRTNSTSSQRKRSISRNSSSNNLLINSTLSNGGSNNNNNNNNTNNDLQNASPLSSTHPFPRNQVPPSPTSSLTQHIPSSSSNSSNNLTNLNLKTLENLPPAVNSTPTGTMSLQQLHSLQVQQNSSIPIGNSNGNTQLSTIPSPSSNNFVEGPPQSRLVNQFLSVLKKVIIQHHYQQQQQQQPQQPLVSNAIASTLQPTITIPTNAFSFDHLLAKFKTPMLHSYTIINNNNNSNNNNSSTNNQFALNPYLFKHGVNKMLIRMKSKSTLKSQIDEQSQNEAITIPNQTDQQQLQQQQQSQHTTASVHLDERPIIEARPRVVVSGYSIGLPNATNPDDIDLPSHNYDESHINREVFAEHNIDRLLGGYSYLSSYTLTEHVKMLAMNPFELGKTPDGKRCKKIYQQPEECIQIQSKVSHFDLSKQYGVPGYVVEALDMAFQLAIAAGLEALVDAGYPVLTSEKVWVEKKASSSSIDDTTTSNENNNNNNNNTNINGEWVEKVSINPFPNPLRQTTGIIFVSSFPGMDSIVDEVERCSISQLRTEVVRMLQAHPLAQVPTKMNQNTLNQEDATKLNDIMSNLDSIATHTPTTTTTTTTTTTNSEAPKLISEKTQQTNIFQDIITNLQQHPVYEYNRKLLFKVLVMANSQLAELLNITGPNTHINAACAGTTQAIAIGDEWLRQTRRCEAVVVIAADIATSKRLLPYISTGFMVLGAASKLKGVVNCSAPFDVRRKGMIVGAGSVGVVLETHYRMTQRRYYDFLFPNNITSYQHEQIITNYNTFEFETTNNKNPQDFNNNPNTFDNVFECIDDAIPIPTWQLEPIPAHPVESIINRKTNNNTTSAWNLDSQWNPKGELLLSHFANSAFHASLIHTSHIAQELNAFLTQAECLYGSRLRTEWEIQLQQQQSSLSSLPPQQQSSSSPSKSKQYGNTSHLPSTYCLKCNEQSFNNINGDDRGDEQHGDRPSTAIFPWKRELSKQLLYFSHETSTSSCARVEIGALRSYFGSELLTNIIVCNTKGFTGHAMGVAFEDVMAVASLDKQITPPIANLKAIDPQFKDVTLSLGGPIHNQNNILFSRLYEDFTTTQNNLGHQNVINKNQIQLQQDDLPPNTTIVQQCCNCTPLYPKDRSLSLRFSAGFGSQLVFLLFKSWKQEQKPSSIKDLYQNSYDIVPVLHPHKRDEIWASFTLMQMVQHAQFSHLQQSFMNHLVQVIQSQRPTNQTSKSIDIQHKLSQQQTEIKRNIKSFLTKSINPATLLTLLQLYQSLITHTTPPSLITNKSSQQSQTQLTTTSSTPPINTLSSLPSPHSFSTLPHPSTLTLTPSTTITPSTPQPQQTSNNTIMHSRPSFESQKSLHAMMAQKQQEQ